MKMKKFYANRRNKGGGQEDDWKAAIEEATAAYEGWVERNEAAGTNLIVVSIDTHDDSKKDDPGWGPVFHSTIIVKYYGNAVK